MKLHFFTYIAVLIPLVFMGQTQGDDELKWLKGIRLSQNKSCSYLVSNRRDLTFDASFSPSSTEVVYNINVRVVEKKGINYLCEFKYSNFKCNTNDSLLKSMISLRPSFVVTAELDKNGKLLNIINENEVNLYYKELLIRTYYLIDRKYEDIQLRSQMAMLRDDVGKGYTDFQPVLKASKEDLIILLALNSEGITGNVKKYKTFEKSPYGEELVDIFIEVGFIENNLITYSKVFDAKQLEVSKRNSLVKQKRFGERYKTQNIGEFMYYLDILISPEKNFEWPKTVRMKRHIKEGFGSQNYQEIFLVKNLR